MASSIGAAALGDAAQAAFDRKLTQNRNELGELRQQKIHHRPLVWTVDGRHPGRHSTASVRGRHCLYWNGQQMSAKSVHRRWKHEIQIALLRRRAAMARAALPDPSAREEWLFVGIIDRGLHHWRHVPLLDGGPGNHDHADSKTDTAIPDDDMASLASCSFESVQPSTL